MDKIRIVFFGPVPWKDIEKVGFRKTSGAMCKALLDRSDVEHIFYVQVERRWGLKIRVQNIDNRLTVVGLPIGMPYERLTQIRFINRWLQGSLLQSVIRSYAPQIYWFYDWWNAELISQLPRAFTVMEITDIASQFVSSERARHHLFQARRLALRCVDLFIPVSVPLAAECQEAQSRTVVLPNGLSREFLTLGRSSQPEPKIIQQIPHPRLCLVSTPWSFNHRVDHQLLLEALRLSPDWNLILIGCEQAEAPGLKSLLSCPRVQSIGMIPVNSLPAYIQHCDLGIVAYSKNAEQSGDRLKIYEYLACGKPVVLTVNEGNPKLLPFLRYADTPISFVRACNDIIATPFRPGEKLYRILNEMTWDHRVATAMKVIQQGLSSN